MEEKITLSKSELKKLIKKIVNEELKNKFSKNPSILKEGSATYHSSKNEKIENLWKIRREGQFDDWETVKKRLESTHKNA